MKNLTLLFCVRFSLPTYSLDSELADYYERSIKPFFQVIDKNKRIKIVAYFSGNVLDWIDRNANEFSIIIKELYEKKQIELLTCGYYEPILQFLTPNERALQLELHIQAIRKIIGKKPKGYYLNDGNWEPNFPSVLDNLNMSYSFINDIAVKYSGYNDDSLFEVFITEDSSNKIFLFPINAEISFACFTLDHNLFVDNLLPLKETKKSNLLTIFIDGLTIQKNSKNISWFESFNERLEKEEINFSLPAEHLKKDNFYKKIYIQSTCDNRCAGKMYYNGQRVSYELFLKNLKNTDFLYFINRGNYRNFLNKYEESNRIYSRMKFTSNIISSYKDDKIRKKEAMQKILKGQSAYAFRLSSDLGVYSTEARRCAYESFIDAEKALKIKNQNMFLSQDFDCDGQDEYISLGQYINVFIHEKGASIFELDYIPSSFNYVNNIKKYLEYSDEKSFEKYFVRKQDLFQDVIWNKEHDVKLDLSNENYEKVDFNSSKKSITFKKKFKELNCELIKTFNIKKNSVIVDYQFKNLSSDSHAFNYMCELNLSLLNINNKIHIQKIDEDKIIDLDIKDTLYKFIKNIVIIDDNNNSVITLKTSKANNLYLQSMYSNIELNGNKDDYYQFLNLSPTWNVQIKPNSVWNLSVELSFSKK